jgi:positive phototaxis protein PixI
MIDTITSVNSAQENHPATEIGEKFLRFQLGAEGIALLPLYLIKQVMQISTGEILPVPQMPDGVLGIYNWRGEMLWLVDLGQLIGFPPLALTNGGNINGVVAIVIQIEDKFLGLVVPQIHDIEWHTLQQIQMPSIGLFTPEIMPYLRGYIIGVNQEILMVLNAEAIASDPLWQVHKQ